MKKIFKIASLVTLAVVLICAASCSKKDASGARQTAAEAAPATARIPQRIVTLSPAATEIIYAVGASNQLVAVSEFSDYPEEAASMPLVGGFDGKTLSLEKILSFKPDFIYMTEGMHNFLIEPLDSYGIAYYLSRGDSIEAVRKEIIDIGVLTGHEGLARTVADKIGEQCAEVYRFKKPVSIYYEVWNSPFMTAGTRSFIHDVITTAGGMNIFADVDDPYPIVSEESIIARAPDVILMPVSNGVSVEDVKARAGWQDIPAVKNGRIYLINDSLFSRPATRVGECVLELNELLAN